MNVDKKTERITLRLEDCLREFLREKATEQRCKESQIVREIIWRALERDREDCALAS